MYAKNGIKVKPLAIILPLVFSRKGSIIVSYIVILDSEKLDEATRHIKTSVLQKLNGSAVAKHPVNFDTTKTFMEKLTSKSAGKF